MAIAHFQKIGNVLTLQIKKEINPTAFEAICREILRNAVDGPIRLILRIHQYPSFNSAEDLYYDLRFLKIYADHIHKVAVLSDRIWKHTWIALFGLFSGVDMAFFSSDQVQSAVTWVSGDA